MINIPNEIQAPRILFPPNRELVSKETDMESDNTTGMETWVILSVMDKLTPVYIHYNMSNIHKNLKLTVFTELNFLQNKYIIQSTFLSFSNYPLQCISK